MMADKVSQIRRTIVRYEGEEAVTDPFDADNARSLYLELFGPIDGEVQALKHLVFEPDGPMLQLPPYLLIAKQAGLDAYKARLKLPKADPFDMRGVDWLGRGREISISVSPRSFLDVRAIAPSRARSAYLGLGNNAPVTVKPVAAVADDCDWPVQTWQSPISRRRADAGAQCLRSRQQQVDDRRGVHRHGLAQGRPARQLPDPAFRDPWPGHRAAARLPAASGAGHLVRRPRIRRTAQLPRDFRSQARCRRGHPVGLRHRRRGQRQRLARGGHHDRRQLCARRAGARLHRRRRAIGDRQPLAGARQLQCHQAADLGRDRGQARPAAGRCAGRARSAG